MATKRSGGRRVGPMKAMGLAVKAADQVFDLLRTARKLSCEFERLCAQDAIDPSILSGVSNGREKRMYLRLTSRTRRLKKEFATVGPIFESFFDSMAKLSGER